MPGELKFPNSSKYGFLNNLIRYKTNDVCRIIRIGANIRLPVFYKGKSLQLINRQTKALLISFPKIFYYLIL